MTDPFSSESPDVPRLRRPYRPPVGIPDAVPQRAGWRGWIASIGVHAGLVLGLLLPALAGTALMVSAPEGSGGARTAGGGGGGGGGRSAFTDKAERLQFLALPPAEEVPAPPPPPPRVEATPLTKPPPTVEVPPPTPTVPPETTAPPATASEGAGAGGVGSGEGKGPGAGPGEGGGVGSGRGTGTGSGTGPGTGGGDADHYPPTVVSLAILPIPVPEGVRPYRMTAVFDVDERGRARLVSFTPSNDRGYNRRIRAMLEEIRFRPATRRDGTPMRDTAVVIAEAP